MKVLPICASLAALTTLAGCTTVDSSWAPFPKDSELTSFSDSLEGRFKGHGWHHNRRTATGTGEIP